MVELLFWMDDNTALWLLSALLQSLAAIWGLFLVVTIQFSINLRTTFKYIREKEIRRFSEFFGLIWDLLIKTNFIIISTLLLLILSIVFFRFDFLILLSINSTILSIIYIMKIIILMMLNFRGHIGFELFERQPALVKGLENGTVKRM